MKSLAGHVVKYGKHRERRSFARISEVLELPNLIEIQTDSYQWFLDEGLREMFEDILPIFRDDRNIRINLGGGEFTALNSIKKSADKAAEKVMIFYNGTILNRGAAYHR